MKTSFISYFLYVNCFAVLFGEQHHQSNILKAQLCVLEAMVSLAEYENRVDHKKRFNSHNDVVLVMEMFNLSQQSLLDEYEAGKISLKELEQEYKDTEGFVIRHHYGMLLEAAKEMKVKLVAGFAPKDVCRAIVKDGETALSQWTKEMFCNTTNISIEGSEKHYRYFQGLISGNMEYVTDKYRKIFPAQVLRDSTFAYKVCEVLKSSDHHTRVLGVCGSGHVDYGFGIPERITKDNQVYVITSRTHNDELDKDVADCAFLYNHEH